MNNTENNNETAIITSFTGVEGLKTRNGAMKRIEKAVANCAGCDQLGDIIAIVAAQPDGTFVPVVQLRGEQQREMMTFAQFGICVLVG